MTDTPGISHYSRKRSLVLVLLSVLPFAYLAAAAIVIAHPDAPHAMPGRGSGVLFPHASRGQSILWLVFGFHITLVMAASSIAVALWPAKRAGGTASDLRFERERVGVALVNIALAHGLAGLFCWLAVIMQPRPVYEVGWRGAVAGLIVLFAAPTALYFVMRPKRIPGVDYSAKEEPEPEADRTRLFVEREFGMGYSFNPAALGPRVNRWLTVALVVIILGAVATLVIVIPK